MWRHLTSNSFDDDMLKWGLGHLLWGYPHLVEFVFSECADVRRRNIEQRWTKQNDREAAPAESERLRYSAVLVIREGYVSLDGWYSRASNTYDCYV